MVSKEKVWNALMALGDDVSVWEDSIDESYCLHVTFEDFDGFDSDWSEISRDYDDEEAVVAFCEMLHVECLSFEDNFYVLYHFDGFDVEVGYASFEI